MLFLSACSSEAEEDAGDRAPPPVVVVEEPRRDAETRRDVILPGRAEAVTQAELAFLVDGRLEAIFVAEGEAVEAGQEIASIDDTDYQVQLRQAQTTEATAAADLARRRVLNREGILSRAAVEEAEANVAQARAQRENAERQVMYTTLRAPYAGQIGRRVAEVGTVVRAGAPIVTMVDSGAVDVAVDVPAAEAVRLPFGPELRGTGHLAGTGVEAELDLAYAEHATVPDARSRTYRLVMRGTPPEGVNILPGMAIRVTIPDPEPVHLAEDEYLVPLASLLSTPEGAGSLFVVDADDRAVRVPVEIISSQDERMRVRGELPDGARIVVGGAEHLTDAQPVRPTVRD